MAWLPTQAAVVKVSCPTKEIGIWFAHIVKAKVMTMSNASKENDILLVENLKISLIKLIVLVRLLYP